MLGNDREREKKRSGLEARKKKIVLCSQNHKLQRKGTEFFFKKKKRRRRRKDTTNGRIMIWQRVKEKVERRKNENQ